MTLELHQILRLPRKVTLELHQILRLPRKVTHELHQMLRLPQKVTHTTGPACHCGRSRLFPSSTFSTPFSLLPIGPACHCGRSRLFPSSTFSTPPSFSLSLLQARLVIVAGPAYLLLSSLHFSLSLSLIGPACHCGRSRLFTLPLLFPTLFTLSPSLL